MPTSWKELPFLSVVGVKVPEVLFSRETQASLPGSASGQSQAAPEMMDALWSHHPIQGQNCCLLHKKNHQEL